MGRTRLQDGSVMLSTFHKNGRLLKVKTDKVEMTPNTTTAVLLSEINEAVAAQKGVTINELALTDDRGDTVATVREVPTSNVEAEAQAARIDTPKTDGVLSDEDLAAQYRSQADAMFKEAKALREQAEALAPTKKKTTKKETA